MFLIGICWVLRDKEQPFKVSLDFSVPLIIGESLLLPCKKLHRVLFSENRHSGNARSMHKSIFTVLLIEVLQEL